MNDPGEGDPDETGGRDKISEKLTRDEMQAELDDRIEKMRAGAAGDGVPDQIRVIG